ncbi:ATP-binding protein [Paenibacillus silviterrae]|uniref:ATP-binding protein n=1 Tax=Paenibacillus silviterrae TaxID=3242194 RepID=UPI002542BD8E|nr:ATP-binding protein [Paenibacillus chinjuensis]
MNDGIGRLERSWTIPSRYGWEKNIMSQIQAELSCIPGAAARLHDMLTAVSEACLNAMEHGNAMNPLLTVSTEMLVREQSVVFRICDQGTGFTPDKLTRRDPYGEANPRGWGMLLMTQLADEVRVGMGQAPFCIELHFAT